MTPFQTPSPLRGRKRLVMALALLAVAAMAVLGVASAADDSDGSTDRYSELFGTVSMTFDPNYDGVDGSLMTDTSNRIDENQRYTGSRANSVTWTDMAVGAEIIMPVYILGTETAVLDVYTDSGKTYKGSYYLSGWISDNGMEASAGDTWTIKDEDMVFHAEWTKIDASTHSKSFHYTEAEGSVAVDETYDFTPVYNSKATDDSSSAEELQFMVRANATIEYATTMKIDAPTGITVTLGSTGLNFHSNKIDAGNHLITAYQTTRGTYVWWVVSADPDSGKEYGYSYLLSDSSSPVPASGTARAGQSFVLNGGVVNGIEIVCDDDSFTLVGWELSDGVNKFYFNLGQRVAMYGSVLNALKNGSLTFSPKWESVTDVVVLSMDGASLRNVEAYAVKHGQTITLPDVGSEVEKTGYTFIGWTTLTQSTATNAPGLYMPGYMMEVDQTVLKAEAFFWPDSDSVSLRTVTFDANGGTLGFPITQKVPLNHFVYLPRTGVAAPDGKEFIGWSTDPGASEPIGYDSEEVTEDVRYYAVYRDSSTPSAPTTYYTVSFNTDGGMGGASTQSVKSGGKATQPTGITKEGNILEYWMDTVTGTAWDFDKAVERNMILKASWSEHFSYTVDGLKVVVTVNDSWRKNYTINWGDGDSGTATEHTYASVNASSRIVVTSIVDDIRYTTYRTLTGMEGEFVPQATECNVTFFSSPGYFPDGSTMYRVKVVSGQTVSAPEENPTAEGKVFSHWALNGMEYDFSKTVYSTLVLMAVYKDVFTISFDANYENAPSIASKTVKAGGFVSLESPGVRDGYVAVGWNTAHDGSGRNVGSAGEQYTPDQSRTLYMIWELKTASTTFRISFDTGSGSDIKYKDVPAGDSFVLPPSTWTGHTLSVWKKDTEEIGEPGDEYTPTESCTLTAVWVDDSTGETVGEDANAPKASITKESRYDDEGNLIGWIFKGSGKGADSFQWRISSDGKRSWSDLAKTKDVELSASDYPDAGTYHIELTTFSNTSTATATAYSSFTVEKEGGFQSGGEDGDGGILDAIVRFFSENTWALFAVVIGIVAVAYYARWFI